MRLRLTQKKISKTSGQAATEYVVLIAVLAAIILSLSFAFQKKLRALAEGKLGNYLEQNFFNPGSLHRLPRDLSRTLGGG